MHQEKKGRDCQQNLSIVLQSQSVLVLTLSGSPSLFYGLLDSRSGSCPAVVRLDSVQASCISALYTCHGQASKYLTYNTGEGSFIVLRTSKPPSFQSPMTLMKIEPGLRLPCVLAPDEFMKDKAVYYVRRNQVRSWFSCRMTGDIPRPDLIPRLSSHLPVLALDLLCLYEQ